MTFLMTCYPFFAYYTMTFFLIFLAYYDNFYDMLCDTFFKMSFYGILYYGIFTFYWHIMTLRYFLTYFTKPFLWHAILYIFYDWPTIQWNFNVFLKTYYDIFMTIYTTSLLMAYCTWIFLWHALLWLCCIFWQIMLWHFCDIVFLLHTLLWIFFPLWIIILWHFSWQTKLWLFYAIQ